MAVTIKSQREIELMRESCKILADVFSQMEKAVHPGVSTLDINNLGEKLIRAHGCIPNFLNYNGYPASICVSVNDEVVHGIPHKDHILHEGDIVSLDAGLIYKGYHSDMARTFPVGQVSEEAVGFFSFETLMLSRYTKPSVAVLPDSVMPLTAIFLTNRLLYASIASRR